MSLAVGLVNLVLGIAYTGYGVITTIELLRDWKRFGFSHFAAAWTFMAFTCGPHHLAHAVHLLLEGRGGGPADLFAVAVGLPAGVIWLGLRIEAFAGGRGDRFIPGTPAWLRVQPTLAGIYVAALAAMLLQVGYAKLQVTPVAVANVVLLGLYLAIGWFVLRTQFVNHPHMAGWSLSGVSLGVVFPTCGLMHLVFAAYSVSGLYHHDVHGFVIDWLSIPAAMYFLWVVHQLYRNALADWHQVSVAAAIPEAPVRA